MHKWENGLGALTQIADAKLKLPHLADWAMKVTAPVLSTPDRKADHRAKDRSAALSQMKPARVRCETLNPQVSPRLAISAPQARPEKVSSAPPAEISALLRPDAWAPP